MQCAPGPSEGCLFIEFAEDDEAGVPRQYRACDVAIDEAVPLFVSYAAGNNEWKEAIDWIDITDEANQSYSLVIMGIIGFAIVLLAFTLYFVL